MGILAGKKGQKTGLTAGFGTATFSRLTVQSCAKVVGGSPPLKKSEGCAKVTASSPHLEKSAGWLELAERALSSLESQHSLPVTLTRRRQGDRKSVQPVNDGAV